jgi:hypothetical protein
MDGQQNSKHYYGTRKKLLDSIFCLCTFSLDMDYAKAIFNDSVMLISGKELYFEAFCSHTLVVVYSS